MVLHLISLYVIDCFTYSNNCGMWIFVLGDNDFKYSTFGNHLLSTPPFKKNGDPQYKCHNISTTTSH